MTKDRCDFIDGETEAHTEVKSRATKAGNGGVGFAPRQSGFRVNTSEMKQVKLTCKCPQDGSPSGAPLGPGHSLLHGVKAEEKFLRRTLISAAEVFLPSLDPAEGRRWLTLP